MVHWHASARKKQQHPKYTIHFDDGDLLERVARDNILSDQEFDEIFLMQNGEEDGDGKNNNEEVQLASQQQENMKQTAQPSNDNPGNARAKRSVQEEIGDQSPVQLNGVEDGGHGWQSNDRQDDRVVTIRTAQHSLQNLQSPRSNQTSSPNNLESSKVDASFASFSQEHVETIELASTGHGIYDLAEHCDTQNAGSGATQNVHAAFVRVDRDIELQDEWSGPLKPPRTAFMCFIDDKKKGMLLSNNATEKNKLLETLAVQWSNLSDRDRAYWDEEARNDKIRFVSEKAEGPWNTTKCRTKKHPLAPKRPMSAFLKYSQIKRSQVMVKNPNMSCTDVSRLLGEMWRTASPSERKPFFEQELIERFKYRQEMIKFRESQAKKHGAARRTSHRSVQQVAAAEKSLNKPNDPPCYYQKWVYVSLPC